MDYSILVSASCSNYDDDNDKDNGPYYTADDYYDTGCVTIFKAIIIVIISVILHLNIFILVSFFFWGCLCCFSFLEISHFNIYVLALKLNFIFTCAPFLYRQLS